MTKSWLFCAVALCALPAAAAAQSLPAAKTEDTALTEIIVTAQKRGENQQDVPVAVTAISGAALQAAGAVDVTDLNRLTPGLHIQNITGFVAPRIRGIGTTAYGAGLENSVAIYLDGVYLAAATGSLMSLANVDQVTTLKGPQGTLFGRNATGGLIQITTRDPGKTPSGHIDIGYANYDTATANGYFSTGLTDTLAGSIAFRVSKQGDGYGRNVITGKDTYLADSDIALSSKLLFTPTEDTTIRLTADYAARRGNSISSSKEAPGTKALFGPVFNGGTYDISSDIDPHDDYKGGGVGLHVDHELGWAKLTSITAYRESYSQVRFDADLSPTPALTVSNTKDAEQQYSEELQLQSNKGSKVEWLGGVYLFNATGRYSPSEVTFGGPLLNPAFPLQKSVVHGGLKTESYAVYGQATMEIAERTHLTAGLRYSSEKRTLKASTEGFLLGGASIGLLGPYVDKSTKYSQPTWRLALDHKLASGPLVYVSYNRGFKSGGFNAAIPTDPAFKPEKLDAYEIGLKSEFFDHRLRFNAAVFDYEYDNIQVGKYTNGQIGYYNGAAARIYGTDMDLTALLAPGLVVTGGVSLLHDRFTSFPNALIATQLPTGGTLTTIGSAKGNRLPQTPDATFNLSVNYERPTASGTWRINGGYYSNSGFYTQSDNLLEQGSYNLFSASIGWRSPNEHFTVLLWGKNLSDERVATTLAASDISTIAGYQPPRTFGITLGADF